MNLFNYLKVTESKFIFAMLIKEHSFMAKVISKKLLIIIWAFIPVIMAWKIWETISDFQRGNTFEGWGDIIYLLLIVGAAIFLTIKYHKQKE